MIYYKMLRLQICNIKEYVKRIPEYLRAIPESGRDLTKMS